MRVNTCSAPTNVSSKLTIQKDRETGLRIRQRERKSNFYEERKNGDRCGRRRDLKNEPGNCMNLWPHKSEGLSVGYDDIVVDLPFKN